MRNVEGFLFGCDPEVFIRDDKGEPIPAVNLIPGTKAEPFPVEYGSVQVDGLAAEIGIDPVDNFPDFDRNVTSVMAQLKDMLPKGYSLLLEPTVEFSKELVMTLPGDCVCLGCDPDFDAWTGQLNPPPDLDLDHIGFRAAAGHLHIGWSTEGELDINDPDHRANCFDFVKQLDWFLGAWSVKKDPNPDRRKLYGRAGACRIKPYGVEYRVLSNFWLKDKKIREEMWLRLQAAIAEMRNNFMPNFADEKVHAFLRETINETDSEKLKKLTGRFPGFGYQFPINRYEIL